MTVNYILNIFSLDLFNFDDTNYDSNWDQDKLDFFLKELI